MCMIQQTDIVIERNRAILKLVAALTAKETQDEMATLTQQSAQRRPFTLMNFISLPERRTEPDIDSIPWQIRTISPGAAPIASLPERPSLPAPFVNVHLDNARQHVARNTITLHYVSTSPIASRPEQRRPRQSRRLSHSASLLSRLAARGALPRCPSQLETIIEGDESVDLNTYLTRTPSPFSSTLVKVGVNIDQFTVSTHTMAALYAVTGWEDPLSRKRRPELDAPPDVPTKMQKGIQTPMTRGRST